MAPSSTLTTTLFLLSHLSYLTSSLSTGPTDLNICMRSCTDSTCQTADTACLCSAANSDSMSLTTLLSCMQNTCSESITSDSRLSLNTLQLACSNAGAALPADSVAAATAQIAVNNAHVEIRQVNAPSVTIDSGTIVGPSFTVGPGSVNAPSATVESGTVIAPSVTVGSGSVNAPSATVESGTVIAPSVTVGPGSVNAPSATVESGTVIAPSVTVEPGSVIVSGGSTSTVSGSTSTISGSTSTSSGAKTTTAENSKSTSSSTASASQTVETSTSSGAVGSAQTSSGALVIMVAVMCVAGLGSLVTLL